MNLHKKIRILMKRHGYTVTSKGVCAGIGGVGLHAILLRDIASFNQRIETLARQDEYDEKFIKQEMLPFFENIALIQYPHLVKQIKSHKSQAKVRLLSTRSKLFAPYELKNKGGIAHVGQFSGVYSVKDLKRALDEIAEIFIDLPQTLLPLVFSIGSGRHNITIGYDGNQWIVVDANQLPAKMMDNTQKVSKMVLSGFLGRVFGSVNQARQAIELSPEVTVVFSAQLYATGENQAAIKAHLSSWLTFQETNIFLQKDSRDVTLINIAAIYNHVELMSHLLEQPDLTKEEIVAALFIATKKGSAETVMTILNYLHNIRKSALSANKAKELVFIAIKSEYIEVIKSLLSFFALTKDLLGFIFIQAIENKQCAVMDYFLKEYKIPREMSVKFACHAAKRHHDELVITILRQADPGSQSKFLIELLNENVPDIFNKWLARFLDLTMSACTILFPHLVKANNKVAMMMLIEQKNFNPFLRTLERALPFKLLFDENLPLFKEVLVELLNRSSEQDELKIAIQFYIEGKQEALLGLPKIGPVVQQANMSLDEFISVIQEAEYCLAAIREHQQLERESQCWARLFPLFHECYAAEAAAEVVCQ